MSEQSTDAVPKTHLGPTPEQTAADARKTIAYVLVGAYVFLVLTSVLLPVGLFVTDRPPGPFSVTDLKDLPSAISGVMAGLVGILGFVVGYYFKSIDDQDRSKESS